MATILDIGILDYFAPVFVFLLIFVVVYGILEKISIFGKTKYVHALIAFCVAMLFLLTTELIDVIKLITPWFVIILIFIMFIIMIFLFAGVKAETLGSTFTSNPTVLWTIIVISFIILGWGLAQVYGESVSEVYAGDAESQEKGIGDRIGEIVFHPKLLGVFFLLFVASQIVRLVSQTATGK
ncbi:hypothetical protein HZB88_01585 [archaeon]|nr:hypothetical protein [archaeon]